MRTKTLRYGQMTLAIMLMFSLSLSALGFMVGSASAEATPTITIEDVNGRTISNTDPTRYVYQNHSTGITPAVQEIYGSWSYSNLVVTVENMYDTVEIDSYMYATWYDPSDNVISYHIINTTESKDIDHVDGHYYYVYGSVSWSDSPLNSINFSQGLGDYRLVLSGKVYDTDYSSSAGHYVTYYGSMVVRCVSDYVYEPTYPQTDSLYAQRNDSVIYSMNTVNAQNVSYPLTAFWGTQAYSNLYVQIGSSVSYYVYYEWVKPGGSNIYAVLTNSTNGYDLLTEVGHSWTVKGGLNYSSNVTLPFDAGYGDYKLVITGKVFDTANPASSHHFVKFYHALTVTYTDPSTGSVTKGPDGSDIAPIILQGMAATGGLMIVCGIMAGIWLWKFGDPFYAICTITILPVIGAGVIQAALG